MSRDEFIKEVKNTMRNNKNSWYNKLLEVDGKTIGLKMFIDKHISIQRLEAADGCGMPSMWDITQKEALNAISKVLDYNTTL